MMGATNEETIMPYAWDIHTHPPSEQYITGAHGPYLERMREHWRDPIDPRPMEAMVEEYRALDLKAVISAWDAETTTGLPAVTNDEVARIVERFPSIRKTFWRIFRGGPRNAFPRR